jgi:hypothetical protein
LSVLQPAQHARLDALPGDGFVIAAGALGTPGGAAIAVLAHHRVPAAALSTDQELAQKELAPVRPIEGIAGVVLAHLDPGLLLAGLDPLPQVIVDDPKLRHLDNLAHLLLVDPGDLLARPGVLHIGGAVPRQPADIGTIVEQTGAAVDLTANGGIAPFPA